MPFIHLKDAAPIKANTLYCIGRNYAEHAKELNNPIPTKPMVFLKPNASLELKQGKVELPSESNDVHHEVELVVLIGKTGSAISKEAAWDYVLGLGVGLDFTARDIQQKAKDKGHPWTLAKGFDTFGPVSEILPLSAFDTSKPMQVDLTVNGEVRQNGTTADMLFSIPELISYVSGFSTLHEGDLIFTGTPEGVAKVNSGDVLVARLDQGKVVLSLEIK
ncbi:fumarylacetoacetate hydrolase family protein [Nodularia spumigena]|uniref:fumarylacetoacetate hydrolase family protein n=1 Tax=Nodularia spumigena TaxID=70799 RepID=UPI002B21666F|nr:fumarylacetoacetate hydrolase family protein [Nodularia spumigena]MEA5557355.1 fumarylacetoacetate hydrolase family protein [Nodularia spumigena CH309]